jgi:hypothetical protein
MNALTLWAALELPRLGFYWHLPLLLILVSLVYSATRFEKWSHILQESLRWIIRLSVFLGFVTIVLFVVASMF